MLLPAARDWGRRAAATKPRRRWGKGYLKTPGEKEHLISISGHSSLCIQLYGNCLSSSFTFPPRKLAHSPCTAHLDYSTQDYTSIFPVLYSARASYLSPFRPLCNKRISKLACARKVIYLSWTATSWVFLILTLFPICSGVRLHMSFRQKSPKYLQSAYKVNCTLVSEGSPFPLHHRALTALPTCSPFARHRVGANTLQFPGWFNLVLFFTLWHIFVQHIVTKWEHLFQLVFLNGIWRKICK